jgi:hypothetical protein
MTNDTNVTVTGLAGSVVTLIVFGATLAGFSPEPEVLAPAVAALTTVVTVLVGAIVPKQ